MDELVDVAGSRRRKRQGRRGDRVVDGGRSRPKRDRSGVGERRRGTVQIQPDAAFDVNVPADAFLGQRRADVRLATVAHLDLPADRADEIRRREHEPGTFVEAVERHVERAAVVDDERDRAFAAQRDLRAGQRVDRRDVEHGFPRAARVDDDAAVIRVFRQQREIARAFEHEQTALDARVRLVVDVVLRVRQIFVIFDDFPRDGIVQRERTVIGDFQNLLHFFGGQTDGFLNVGVLNDGVFDDLDRLQTSGVVEIRACLVAFRILVERRLVVNRDARADDGAFVNPAHAGLLLDDEQAALHVAVRVRVQRPGTVRVPRVVPAGNDERRPRARSRDDRRVGRALLEPRRRHRAEHAARVVRGGEHGLRGGSAVRHAISRVEIGLKILDRLVFGDDERSRARRREVALLDRRILRHAVVAGRGIHLDDGVLLNAPDRGTLLRTAVRLIRSRDVHGRRVPDGRRNAGAHRVPESVRESFRRSDRIVRSQNERAARRVKAAGEAGARAEQREISVARLVNAAGAGDRADGPAERELRVEFRRVEFSGLRLPRVDALVFVPAADVEVHVKRRRGAQAERGIDVRSRVARLQVVQKLERRVGALHDHFRDVAVVVVLPEAVVAGKIEHGAVAHRDAGNARHRPLVFPKSIGVEFRPEIIPRVDVTRQIQRPFVNDELAAAPLQNLPRTGRHAVKESDVAREKAAYTILNPIGAVVRSVVVMRVSERVLGKKPPGAAERGHLQDAVSGLHERGPRRRPDEADVGVRRVVVDAHDAVRDFGAVGILNPVQVLVFEKIGVRGNERGKARRGRGEERFFGNAECGKHGEKTWKESGEKRCVESKKNRRNRGRKSRPRGIGEAAGRARRGNGNVVRKPQK